MRSLRGLPLALVALLVAHTTPALAQSTPGFFPERYVTCREPRPPRVATPAPAAGGSLVPLSRRAAPPPLPIAPLMAIDVARAEPVPERATRSVVAIPEPPRVAASAQDWRCVGFTRGKAGILRVLGAPPLARFAGHQDPEAWRLLNARAASAAGFAEAVPALRRLLARPVPESNGPELFDALDAWLNGAHALGDLGDAPSAASLAAHLVTREDRSFSLIWLAGLPALAHLDPRVAESYAADVVQRVVRGRSPHDPHAAGDDTLLRGVLPLLITPDPARLALVKGLPGSDSRCDVLAARVRLGDLTLRDTLRSELDRDLRTQRGVACYSDLMPVVFSGVSPDETTTLLYRHRLDALLDLLHRGRTLTPPPPGWERARTETREALAARSADPDVAGGRGDSRYQPVKRARHLVARAVLGDAASRAEVEALIIDERDLGVAPWVAAALALRFEWPGAADHAAQRLALARQGRTQRFDTDLDPVRGFVSLSDHVAVVDALAERGDARFALGLLDRERPVREATAMHLARRRLPATCDVVTRAAPEAEETAVQDAFWALSMLGDTCREQAFRLARDPVAPPHVRGMALELLAMQRDPRARALVADRGRDDDIRPARARARVIFFARE